MSINLATQRLIDDGQAATVEFISKPSDLQKIGEAVCAFLNSNGGTVIAGPTADGEHVTDAQHSATVEHAEQIRRYLYENVSPNSVLSVSVDDTLSGRVLVIDVPNGRDTPYTFDGRVFQRVGRSVKVADSQAMREMVLGKGTYVQRWERRPSPTLSVKDLDRQLIDDTVRRAGERRGFVFSNPDDIDSVLQQLEVAEFGQLTNGADVVFGKKVFTRLPQTRVRAVCFETDRSGDFVDDQLLEGPALTLLDDILVFIKRHVSVAAKFNPDQALRIDVPEFPFDAVHEGIVNALVHRDYSAFSGSVKISVYPGRLEIWNSGKLPKGITAKKLEMAHHESILVNPDISHVFYLHGQMERIGRGTYNIVRQCRSLGLRTPEWKCMNDGVRLTFFSAQTSLRSDLNERQIALVEDVAPGTEVLTSTYREKFAANVADRTARRDLEKLEDFGFLKRTGVGRGTVYLRTELQLD